MEDRVANKRSAFSLSFTLALYISNGFGLRYNPMVAPNMPAIFVLKGTKDACNDLNF